MAIDASVGPSAVTSFIPPSFVPGGPNAFDNGSSGMPGAGLFVFFFIVVVLIGIGTTVWRVSTARRIAEQNGLDPRMATRVALMDDNAVTATYLASNLQAQREQSAPSTPAGPVRSVKARLDELQQLHDAGEITDDEYAEGRKHIINGA